MHERITSFTIPQPFNHLLSEGHIKKIIRNFLYIFYQAQDELDEAKKIYQQINDELHTDLPMFHER